MIEYEQEGPAATVEQLDRFTVEYPWCPSKFLEFMGKRNGAILRPNSFETRTGSDRLREIMNLDLIVKASRDLELSKDRFAWGIAECGNYLLLDSTGAILYWDHERLGTSSLAGAISDFWDCVVPDDVSWAKERVKSLNVQVTLGSNFHQKFGRFRSDS